jgi:hypothetical protein
MNDVKVTTGYRKRAVERPVIGARAAHVLTCARTLPAVPTASPPGVDGGYIFGAKSVESQVHCVCADWC